MVRATRAAASTLGVFVSNQRRSAYGAQANNRLIADYENTFVRVKAREMVLPRTNLGSARGVIESFSRPRNCRET